ncbi:MAG: transcription elongation factor GreA [Patescibacteria group bacterium]|nr:transcription elongation factor GreA [Patescibacteria group bacterium]
MIGKTHYLSPEGLEKLKAELQELKTVRVRETANRIEAAKALGDLRENSEYHSAKDEMAFIQGRIREIEETLKDTTVIENASGSSVVKIGSTVEVEAKGVKRSYKIVGSEEAAPLNGLISNESPMGKAFLNHAQGDQVDVETPGGVVTYNILKIS